jgi:hypothetical protein
MTLDIAQSITMLLIGILAIVILLKILAIVHKQARHVHELEMRMKAMEMTDEETMKTTNDTTDETEN